MPDLTCQTYQNLQPTEQTVTLDTTDVTNLFATSTLVLMGTIIPHPDNVGVVKIGYDNPPANSAPLQLLFAGRSFRYNFADVKVQADNAGDKVIVFSTPYPYN